MAQLRDESTMLFLFFFNKLKLNWAEDSCIKNLQAKSNHPQV